MLARGGALLSGPEDSAEQTAHRPFFCIAVLFKCALRWKLPHQIVHKTKSGIYLLQIVAQSKYIKAALLYGALPSGNPLQHRLEQGTSVKAQDDFI